MVLTLESLPAEIVLQICQCLDRDYMASVVAFACASKYCYSIAASLLFRTIKFYTSTRLEYFRDIQECHDMLQRTASFRHVRRMVVDGSRLTNGRELEPSYQWHRPWMSAKERGYGNEVFEWGITTAYASRAPPSRLFYESNDDWKPLASLVKQLPSLMDFIFAYDGQFPPCLLQELQNHGQCRLHINRFRLRSLHAPIMDAHEFMLASSPLLYSIGVEYYGMSPYQLRHALSSNSSTINYMHEAIIQLVAGVAPNLSEVHIFQGSPGRYHYNGQGAWSGFTLDNKNRPLSRGALRCLQLSGYDGIHLLRSLRAHNDFSLLRTLLFKSGIDEITHDFLATNCSFPSLTGLALRLVTMPSSDVPLSKDYYRAASRFLRSLPPLCMLTLSGNIPQIVFDSVLDHHGSGLHKLHLHPRSGTDRISLEDIARIKEHCPLLEDLRLAVHRSRGDYTETATYKAIGSITSLREVGINLDTTNFCEQPEPPNVTFDEFDQQYFQDTLYASDITQLPSWHTYNGHTPHAFNPRNGQIRDVLINNAIDRTLAQQIFAAISSGKPIGSVPLDRLKVWANENESDSFHGYSGPDNIRHAILVLGQSWQIKRNPRADSRQKLLAQQLHELDDMDFYELDKLIEPIFRKLWPSKHKDGSNWRTDWHSWPLSTLDT
ncbi:hypothetical protein V492_07853 [Pseudogymnoascus sp. VKM F-4246]|nr:hypothetical protein V492_07853 [Pseudogymnoascus sp. VKM F-4246]